MGNNFCSVHKFYLHVHMILDACDQFHSHAQDFWHLIPKIKKCWKCTKHTTYTRYTVAVPVSESVWIIIIYQQATEHTPSIFLYCVYSNYISHSLIAALSSSERQLL